MSVVKSKGFKDAFIVAWYNGKKVTPQRAQSLEGAAQQSTKTVEADAGKIYKIQIGTYDNELPADIAKTIKAIALGKEVSRTDNGQGQNVFFLGNYSSLDEAQRVKDNLVASGVVNAVVITIELDKK